jgi:type I restriction enzyme M protein
MTTGTITSQIDQLREAFWSGGIANPYKVIEQTADVMFIRHLDDPNTVAQRMGAGERA